MCGIAGFTHRNWLPPPERIRQATSTLIHRGPDQQGVHETTVFSFGATRLKIIDLASGDQPILAQNAEYGIVFNGEIYNHLELRAELEQLGHSFESHSDTETVLRAFMQWDKECFARLRGMFAVALWHKSARRMVLARDRMGIKPLYIARQGEDLYFASELKAIFVHPEIERRLSLQGLDCYLALNYVPCPWTLVEGVEKLPAGCWMEWRDGLVTSETYWRLPCGVSQDLELAGAKEELDSLLQSAVKEHLLSDVPLGVWLSGGIDSSAILHYAAQATSSKLKTFSISFRGRSFDETKYIADAVKKYSTDHEEMDLNPQVDLQGAIEEFAYYTDEPSADAGSLPVWFLSRLCKRKTTVALSGEGADELFGGYLTYRANRIAARMRWAPSGLWRLATALVKYWPASDEKISFEYKVKRFLQGAQMEPERAHVYWNGTFSDDEKKELMRASLPESLRKIIGEMNSLSAADDLSPFTWWDQKYFLADDILVKSDRMSMAHSVEVRPVFLDHRVVEFAAKLPARMKIQGAKQKVVLRDLMKDKLPPAIFRHGKIGFDIPAHDWLRGSLRPMLEETLREGIREYGQLFHGDVIDSLAKRHAAKQVNAGYQLWGLLILFQWLKKWKIQAAAPSEAAAFTPAGVGTLA